MGRKALRINPVYRKGDEITVIDTTNLLGVARGSNYTVLQNSDEARQSITIKTDEGKVVVIFKSKVMPVITAFQEDAENE